MKQLLLAIVLMGIMMQEIQMKVKECIMMVKLIGYVKDVILRIYKKKNFFFYLLNSLAN